VFKEAVGEGDRDTHGIDAYDWIIFLPMSVACQFCCKIAVISSAKNRLAVNEITASYFLARYDN
jgi:phage gp36-like protein